MRANAPRRHPRSLLTCAITPGGFTGFGGWRIFDIADRTGKVARAGAVISVEMIMGQLAFGLVVMMGSVFGSAFIGTMGVVLVNLGFAVIVSIGLTFLARPHLFRVLAGFLPANIRARIHTLIDAVCAYQGWKHGLERPPVSAIL